MRIPPLEENNPLLDTPLMAWIQIWCHDRVCTMSLHWYEHEQYMERAKTVENNLNPDWFHNPNLFGLAFLLSSKHRVLLLSIE